MCWQNFSPFCKQNFIIEVHFGSGNLVFSQTFHQSSSRELSTLITSSFLLNREIHIACIRRRRLSRSRSRIAIPPSSALAAVRNFEALM